jgi:hypothetical protein|tara:strand:+ start:1556 stop:2041 length:486 start_codon:yes stop_codon:yes gene_type:complete
MPQGKGTYGSKKGRPPKRVKLMHGGRPSARTRHIENEKEEIRRVDANIRRNEGYKTGGRVKKAKGGSTIRKLADTIGKDIKDSRKKLNVHQDPRSGLAASLRHMRDNPSKKKPSSPHTAAPKKRTMKDMYPRDGFKPGLMRRIPSGGPKKRPLRKLPTKKK